jgi:hypothetical protein
MVRRYLPWEEIDFERDSDKDTIFSVKGRRIIFSTDLLQIGVDQYLKGLSSQLSFLLNYSRDIEKAYTKYRKTYQKGTKETSLQKINTKLFGWAATFFSLFTPEEIEMVEAERENLEKIVLLIRYLNSGKRHLVKIKPLYPQQQAKINQCLELLNGAIANFKKAYNVGDDVADIKEAAIGSETNSPKL